MKYKKGDIVVTTGFRRVLLIEDVRDHNFNATVQRGIKDPDEGSYAWTAEHVESGKTFDLEEGDVFEAGDEWDVINKALMPLRCTARDRDCGIIEAVSEVDGTEFEFIGREPIKFISLGWTKHNQR